MSHALFFLIPHPLMAQGNVPFFGLIIAVIGLIKLSVEIRNDYPEGQQVAFFIFIYVWHCMHCAGKVINESRLII